MDKNITKQSQNGICMMETKESSTMEKMLAPAKQGFVFCKGISSHTITCCDC